MTDANYCVLDLGMDAEALNAAISDTEKPYIAFSNGSEDEARAYFDLLFSVMEVQDVCDVAVGGLRTSKGKPLSFQKHLPNEAAILHADDDYSCGLLYPDGVLCRTQALRESSVRFDENLACCRDELFAMALSVALPAILYVPECSYASERIFDETSPNVPQASVSEWYWEAVHEIPRALRDMNGGRLARVSQYGLLYMLIRRFESNHNTYVKAVFKDLEETQEFIDASASVLREIGDDIIFCWKPAVAWTRPRLVHLARLKYGRDNLKWGIDCSSDTPRLMLENAEKPQRIETMGSTALIIQGLELARDESGRPGLSVTARWHTSFPDSMVSVFLVNSFEGGCNECQMTFTPILASTMTFFDEVAYNNMLYTAFIPFAGKTCHQTITAYAIANDTRKDLRIGIHDVGPNHLSENHPEVAWHIPHHAVRSKDWHVEITPESNLRWKMRQARYCRSLSKGDKYQRRAAVVRRKYLLTKPLFRGKRIWVFFDKSFKGGDNGEFAFRYAASQNDGIEHLFFIHPDSRDGKLLAEEGYEVLRPGDPDAIVRALHAEVMFYTHVPAFKGIGIHKKELRYYKDLLNPKLVRMYHGFMLTHDPSYARAHMNAMGVVVGSNYEHDLCAEPVHGWEESQIIDSGMPRHDGLVTDNKRQLMFAPTWRPTLRMGTNAMGETVYNPDFKQSRYYQIYAGIFSDERLLECARKHNYKIKLFLHPRMAPQTADFESNDVFEALDCTKDSDYVTMMRQSDLMVTDFSSVMVDFAYSRKPVVYYQDPALPYWRYVDFDYEGIGFGEVCRSADELIDVLCDYMRRDCTLKDVYRKRIDDFFFYDDQGNSKRLYETVRKMTDGGC